MPPLATVEIGVGNCGDGTEGAIAGKVIGTYPARSAAGPQPRSRRPSARAGSGREPPPLVRPEVAELRRQRLAAVRKLSPLKHRMNSDLTTFDVLIIGGGHNGLVAAAYLARAGRQGQGGRGS